MSRTTRLGLAMIAGFIGLLVAVSAAVIDFDAASTRGIAIGTSLGLVNLALGSFVTHRSLRHGMKSAVGTLVGGFFARCLVLVVLFVVFQRTDAVDPAAFALTFLTCFFVYMGVELVMVERVAARRTA